LEIIKHYFGDLNTKQTEQFAQLDAIYRSWNEKINVISRKDIDLLYERHVLHSLSIAKVISFKPNTDILDVGTGGGFPGIPLAILFPECKFTLVDSIGKKVQVVKAVSEELGLKNVEAFHMRAEQLKVAL
jgi:16S rRNA (guanine527-N7)-methyltransferase